MEVPDAFGVSHPRLAAMSRGPSRRQRQVLALLVTEKCSLDVTAELLPMLGLEVTDVTRRSQLRALRLLEQRGLVTLERVPSERGGHPRVLASARPGARGELTAAELQRTKVRPTRITIPKDVVPQRRAINASVERKGTQKQERRPRPGPVCERCDRPATHNVWGMHEKSNARKFARRDLGGLVPGAGLPQFCREHAEEQAEHQRAGGCDSCVERKATHSVTMFVGSGGVSPLQIVKQKHAPNYCLRCAKLELVRQQSRVGSREH